MIKDTNYLISKIVEEVDELDIKLVKPKSIIENSIDLNSMNSLLLIILIEDEYGITLTDSELKKCKTFEDLYNFIQSKCKKN